MGLQGWLGQDGSVHGDNVGIPSVGDSFGTV